MAKDWKKLARRITEDRYLTELFDAYPRAEGVFYRMIAAADDYGRLPADTPLLRAKICPRSSLPDKKITTEVNRLVNSGKVARYSVRGEEYLAIVNYHRYQETDWSKTGKPEYPAPPDWEPPAELVAFVESHATTGKFPWSRYGVNEPQRTSENLSAPQTGEVQHRSLREIEIEMEIEREGERAPAGAPPSPLSDFEHGTGAEQTPQRLVPGLSAQQVEERNFVAANPLTPDHVRALLSLLWGPDWHRTTTERKPGVDWPGELCLLWTDPEAPVNREDCLALLKRYKPRRTEHPSEWWARVGPRPPDGPRDPIDVHRERAAWDWNHPWELPTPAPIQRQCSRWEELIFRLTIARDPRLREVMDAYHAAHIAYRDTKDAEAFPMPPFPPEEVNVE